MKPFMRSLKKNQQVWGTVEENIALDELVINFQGDLVRVANHTGKKLRAGSRVLLSVEDLEPLKFRLLSPRSNTNTHHLDLTI